MYRVCKQQPIRISVNFIVMKHVREPYHLWPCLCRLVSFTYHWSHGQSFQWNGNLICSMWWAFHRGAYIYYVVAFWMASISFVCINCQRVQSFCYQWIEKSKRWMCWKKCMRSICDVIFRYSKYTWTIHSLFLSSCIFLWIEHNSLEEINILRFFLTTSCIFIIHKYWNILL